jgi:hypothetical protein
VYRASNLPDPAGTVRRWRAEARRLGFDGIYLCNVESMPKDKGLTRSAGFDAAVEFAPDWQCLPPVIRPLALLPAFLRKRILRSGWSKHHVFEYVGLRQNMLAKPDAPYVRFPGVTPSWDNSARRTENAFIFRNANPEGYERWLEQIVEKFTPPSPEENFIFINAWNEWAEGNHLEPCHRWGHQYLDATRRALDRANASAQETRSEQVHAGPQFRHGEHHARANAR